MTAGSGSAPRGRALAVEVARLVRPWRWLLAVVVACVLGSAVAELVPPFVVRHVIDHNLLPRHSSGLAAAGLLYLGALGADAALVFAYSYLAALIAQRALARLRVLLFAHLMRLPVRWFDDNAMGDVISRATADVETVDELFTDGVATLVGQLVPLIAVVIAMIALSPALSLVAAVIAPPLLAITRFLQVRVRNAERATRIAVGQLNTQLSEAVGGAETIRAFAAEQPFIARFRAALTDTVFAQSRSTLYNAYYAPAVGLLSSVVIAALLWVGAGGAVPTAGVSLGTLAAFILLFQRFFAPILAVGDEWQAVQAALAGVERVFDVLAVAPESATPPAAASADARRGMHAVGVTFGYRDAHPILHDVTMHVRPGEHVAVVGRTGAGKSSLVALLSGLYTPWSGTVCVDGRDPRGLTEDERRATLGVVPQTVQLFSGSLRDNLTLFDARVPDHRLTDAAAIAGLQQVYDGLSARLDTPLTGGGGGTGLALSAGQRQLVALARALVAEPAVLLLDEATAAIDGASDAAFRAALRRTALDRGTAVLTVAHRISTARDADRVIVLDAGRIVEDGPPDTLIRAGGRFAALVQLEEAGWDWSEAPADPADTPSPT